MLSTDFEQIKFWMCQLCCLYRTETLNGRASNATNHRPGNGHASLSPSKSTAPLRQRCHIDLLKPVRYGPVVPDVPPAGCDAPAAGPDSVHV